MVGCTLSPIRYGYAMQRLQAYKYELKPNGEQQRNMRRFAGSCRFVFNKALALQKANHEAGNKFIGYVAMAKYLTAWRNSAETGWLSEAPVHPLQHALKDLERAYKNFFAKRADFPRFKKKGMGDSFRYHFTFHPDRYPGRPPFYQGSYRFQKHYYGGSRIHDLRYRTDKGNLTEEFVCARAIEEERRVKHWVRNVDQDEKFSFWLPTSTDYFYPDFVAELTDGRVLAVEYKGAHLLGNADTREKAQVGHQWEATSGGRCLFLMAVWPDQDPAGRSLERVGRA